MHQGEHATDTCTGEIQSKHSTPDRHMFENALLIDAKSDRDHLMKSGSRETAYHDIIYLQLPARPRPHRRDGRNLSICLLCEHEFMQVAIFDENRGMRRILRKTWRSATCSELQVSCELVEKRFQAKSDSSPT